MPGRAEPYRPAEHAEPASASPVPWFRFVLPLSGRSAASCAPSQTETIQTYVIAIQVTRQWAKICRFTIAAQQQMQRAVYVQAIQCRFSTADVGRFSIVNPAHTVMLQHNFKAMRQTSECG